MLIINQVAVKNISASKISSCSFKCYIDKVRNISPNLKNSSKEYASNHEATTFVRGYNAQTFRTNISVSQNTRQNKSFLSHNSHSRTQSGNRKLSQLTYFCRKSTSSANHHHSEPQQLWKVLHTSLVKSRRISLPLWISPRYYSFTLSELYGHGSFILVAISYAVDDYLLLRVMAVAGSMSMLVFTYFHPHGRVLWLPFRWNVLFIALNSYRIGHALYEAYMTVFLDDDMLELHRLHLPLIELPDFSHLVNIGTVEVFKPGEVITDQGVMNRFMRIIIEGEAVAYRDDVATYGLEVGNFITEYGMHAGLEVLGGVESCCTTKAKKTVRCLRWDRTELMDLCLDNKALYRSLQFALCWDIVRKLKNQRNYKMNQVVDPEQLTIKRKEQTNSRYTAILENILHHHGDLDGHQDQLANYRMMHQVDDEQHLKALKHCGWTEEEYNRGWKAGEEVIVEQFRHDHKFHHWLERFLR